MTKIPKECKHKWLPNGTVTYRWSGTGASGNTVISAIFCEKCGEIRTKNA